jgi:hypothetical protein
MSDSLVQPFRRNLDVDPIIIGFGLQPVAVAVQSLAGTGVTSFKMHNPNPFWVWYRGWRGAQGDMPTIIGKGHYIGPGATDICRTQMPQWIAAQPDDEPGFPIYDDDGTTFLYTGKRLRLIMVYGSGA